MDSIDFIVCKVDRGALDDHLLVEPLIFVGQNVWVMEFFLVSLERKRVGVIRIEVKEGQGFLLKCFLLGIAVQLIAESVDNNLVLFDVLPVIVPVHNNILNWKVAWVGDL